MVDVTTVDDTLAEISKIPIGKIKESEKEKLKDLESFLHKRIVGQDEAITEISRAMRRARSGIEASRKTIGSFLFLGPTGVGKTETAKALSGAYFGEESKMIRLDMTEFQGNDALARLIGNPQTQSPGQLASLIRQNPYGVLLLDEFEKSSQDVQNLFLQIVDEGNLTDAFGKKVSFANIIIVATSNAGAEYIREQVEKGEKELSKKLVEYVLSQNLFSPELINRFDATVVYKPLTQEEVTSVAKLMLTSLAQDIKETKNITLEVTDNLASEIAQKGYDPAFGARPIKRLIADKIEDQIAKLVISETIKNGDTINSEDILKFLS
jgi:ATP-dependent Clp protease ATP-binding subunit ClpA